MLALPMRYCVTRLAAICLVVGVLALVGICGGVVVVLAVLAYNTGMAVARSGSGYDWGCWSVVHLMSGAAGGAMGGQGAAFIGGGVCVMLSGGS